MKGVIAQLIKFQDATTIATLEVDGGGNLCNAVVDMEQKWKIPLEIGYLHIGVTIILLNKIQGHTISSTTQKSLAKIMRNGNTRLPLSLVSYEDEIELAMSFVFLSAWVCNNSDATKGEFLSQVLFIFP